MADFSRPVRKRPCLPPHVFHIRWNQRLRCRKLNLTEPIGGGQKGRMHAHLRTSDPFTGSQTGYAVFFYFLEIAEFLLVGGEWNAVFPQNCLQRMLHTPVLRGCADAQGYRLPATDCGSCHPASARTKIHLKTVELLFHHRAPASEIQDSIALSSSLCPQSHGKPGGS